MLRNNPGSKLRVQAPSSVRYGTLHTVNFHYKAVPLHSLFPVRLRQKQTRATAHSCLCFCI